MDSIPRNKNPEFKREFLNDGFPFRFINRMIKQFKQKSSEKDDFIILPSLIGIPK